MEYYKFKEELLLALHKHYTVPYRIETDVVTKNNGQKMDAIRIHLEGSMIAPTIYPRQIFDMNRKEPIPIDQLIQQLDNAFVDESNPLSQYVNFISSYDWAKDHVILKVINQDANQELLKNIPHFPLSDLAIYFSLLLPNRGNEYGTIQITNRIMEEWGVTESELYDQAQINTPHLLPARLRTMDSFLPSFPPGTQVPQDMYILTNQYGICGASCIAYNHLLKDLANQFNSSYFILPSSIHECILLPAPNMARHRELTKLVQEVNDTVLEPTEILSNHAYFYNCKSGDIVSLI
ncbi:MAG: hypothetical protein E7277_06575 [Lachnospiraceae bacterium]|nr:hypothetical protein [Lachnospiraceae bacterium]